MGFVSKLLGQSDSPEQYNPDLPHALSEFDLDPIYLRMVDRVAKDYRNTADAVRRIADETSDEETERELCTLADELDQVADAYGWD